MDFEWLKLIFDGVTTHPVTFSGLVALFITVLLLCCSAIISASEVAFFSLDPQEIEELEESSHNSEQNILRFIKSPQRLLGTILIGNNFVNIGVILLLTYFTNTVLNFERAPVLGFLFNTIIITFAILLFGSLN